KDQELVLEDSVHGFAGQALTTVERHELDEERHGVHLSAQPSHQIGCRARCSTGGEKVVDDQDALAVADGIGVHLERIGSVLERVGLSNRLRRELPRLAHWSESSPDAIGYCCPENKP